MRILINWICNEAMRMLDRQAAVIRGGKREATLGEFIQLASGESINGTGRQTQGELALCSYSTFIACTAMDGL